MWFENFGLDLFVVPVDFAIFPMVNQYTNQQQQQQQTQTY